MPKKQVSNEDQTTWKVFTVAALILGAIFAWQAIKGSSPAMAPRPADTVAAPQMAAAAAAPAGGVATMRGKNKKGQPLPPDFNLPEIFSGNPIKLAELEGKVVLVDFWATWCGPCRMEIPHFVELQNTYKKQGFTMVGISLDQQGVEMVKNFSKQWKINYPIVIDSSGEVASAYGGIRSIPTTYLIGRDGTVKETIVGYRPKEVFEEAIKKALKEI